MARKFCVRLRMDGGGRCRDRLRVALAATPSAQQGPRQARPQAVPSDSGYLLHDATCT